MRRDEMLPLLRQISEDRRAHGSWLKPGFHAVAAHRLGVWRLGLPRLLRPPFTLVYWLTQLVVRYLYGIEMPTTVRLGRRVILPHGGKIVIVSGTQGGDDSIIRHNGTGRGARTMAEVPP